MNDKQMKKMLYSLDNDFLDEQIQITCQDLEIDIKSISQKAHTKLRKVEPNMKKRKIVSFVAVCLIAVVSVTTTVYGEEISKLFNSIFNKSYIDSVVVDGDGYYLEKPIELGKFGVLHNATFTQNALNIDVEYKEPYTQHDVQPIIYFVGADGQSSMSDGYSEKDLYGTSTKVVQLGYHMKNAAKSVIKISIENEIFEISLKQADKVDINDIIAVNDTVDGVHIGYRELNDDIQFVVGFDNPDLKLVSIGEPKDEKLNLVFENLGNGGTRGGGNAIGIHPLTAYDSSGNSYKFKHATDSNTVFGSNVPNNTPVNIEIPSIIARISEQFGKANIKIPEIGQQIEMNEIMDFDLQKINMKSIKRTDATQAEIIFDMNIEDNKDVNIKIFDIYSTDIKSYQLVCLGNEAILTIQFDESCDKFGIIYGHPELEIKGNWIAEVK